MWVLIVSFALIELLQFNTAVYFIPSVSMTCRRYIVQITSDNQLVSIPSLGCEADHSPPSSAVIRKTWIYTSILRYAFMA
jgi:hypothetical protein